MLVNISIEEAKEILLNQDIKINTIDIPIVESLGYVLGEDIISDINMPPFDRSPLDGYALKSDNIKDASKENPIVLEVIDYVPAGYVSSRKIENGQAIRIMTGAKIPEGADVIIKYEDTEFTDKDVKIFNYLKPNSNIVKMGEDIEEGDIVLKKGHLIGPADIGIFATLGRGIVKVYSKPKVAILATGDELIDIDEIPREGKIRNSNSYTIAAQIKRIGGQPVILGICRDKIEDIKNKLKDSLEWADMVITTGGVSVGDADLVKEAFQEIGGEILFWKVNMKPGTPIAVAKYGNKLIFGLSGNPAAASITFEKFVRPTILRLMGKSKLNLVKVESTLENEFTKVSNQNRYVRAITYYKDGQFFTKLPNKHSSGVLTSLSGTNSLFYIRAGNGPFENGDKIEVEILDYPEVE
ncbi:molybdopterin molybdotransferase MoeA [Tissierella carlieri]|uniref:Molybdopterin molybdenumtransferase n=1 Tax=Tissierella carlieri TaxID=689904 RepID=A0ABT1SGQ3_9FIRM|nr:gephyrin-like molybdotransferase Glp [Tissierella carlieri]MCQ4925663.1 molybdopterin molybdotransferase MoeA [Tissierella carlieri]